MKRSILHCDMNNFYASVERLYDKRLLGKPVAVCGDAELRHGIVLAKSEEAKRCGVKTGEAIWQAKAKCPELVTVPTHFDRYVRFSRMAKALYCEYTDLVESFGLDECWLDVTASRLAFGDGVTIGEAIRRRVREELGLTVSVGVSYNKVFAKLGSDLKKPDALTEIRPEDVPEKVWPLPVEELLWIGPKAAGTLHRFGIHTLGQLAVADDRFLAMQFGKNGAMMKENARGEDGSPVLPFDAEPPMKSIGHGMTVPRDLVTPEEVWLLIFALFQEVGKKLRFHKRLAHGVAIHCKDRYFTVKSFQRRLSEPTDCTGALAVEAYRLFLERYRFSEPIRAITVRAIDLENVSSGQQLSLFTDPRQLRGQVLDEACDRIQSRFGPQAISAASLLKIHVPEDEGYVPFSGPTFF